MHTTAFPKVLLHEHLDGGLRVETILELAREQHYNDLPTADPDELAEWFNQGGSGSLERYLEPFRHTVGLMQTAAAIERVAYESACDLAADGVVLGHGIHIIDDCLVEDGEIVSLGKLASYVRDHQVPLEVCVRSNLDTGDYPTPADHPIGALYRAGFAVTLSTDSRLMSRTSMSDEFALVVEHHHFGIRDLREVTETAMKAAFCSLPTKERLLTERIRPGYEMAGV